jgi:immune inhibitor A
VKHKMKGSLFSTLLALALLLLIVVPAAGDTPAAPKGIYDGPDAVRKEDHRADPLSTQQGELLEQALEAQIHGKAYGKTHEVARGQYVELAREGEDPVWTVLGEFSDFPHNSIAEPDRAVDNSTIWTADFDRDYYMDMLFAEGDGVNSMRQYYIEQSSNRYTVHGDVTDWVPLPGVACDYDDGDPGPGGALEVWQFLIDSLDGWYDAQIAAGKTPAEIDEYLSGFDVWDRYEWDGDGNFDEPDGYIDHAQFVHAGEGNEAGGGALGDCAIWSHSWFAYFNLIGIEGPSPDFLIGGVQIGDSSYWVNKYTIQPENGGVGVFAHEYGHDLGLPDLYDYSGENSVGFWSLMATGSWLSDGTVDLGSKPCHMGVWEKFQLGWLNYEVAYAGQKSEHKLGPAETNTKQAQGLFVVLPPKEVIEEIADPYSGDHFYYSGAGNELDNWMFKPFNLAPGSSLSAMVNVAIEYAWDYAYLVVSTDGGATWTNVETNLSTTDDPNGQNFGYGITGSSGGAWILLTADLSAFTGDVLLGFRYWTDLFVVEPGFMVDDIEVTGYALDDAETDAGWTFAGFRLSTGVESGWYSNYYVAEFRQYRGYDEVLATAYNLGWYTDPVLTNWAEHFPYQDGLLVSYWDNSFTDNNVGANCGAGRCGGLLLPIDAHPELMYRADGGIWRNRIQTYDSTFGLEPTDAITLHWQGEESVHPSLPAVRVFDDNIQYYRPANPVGGVINPHTGTQIRVKSVSAQGSFMQVQVNNKPPVLGSISPSSGSGPAGEVTYFETSWADANGQADLKHCYFHIGASPSRLNNVALMYNAVRDKLWLLDDSGSTWTGGFAPGSADVLENSQAKVHCSLTSAYGSGETLYVNWAIEFKPGYTGAKKLGLTCKDRGNAKAAGKWMGTWTITP